MILSPLLNFLRDKGVLNMLDKNTIVKVTNRDNGSVGYKILDLGVNRQFMKNETKEIPMEELRKLSYQPGGLYILENCLVIDNDEAIEELLHGVEPEYKYTEKDVEYILTQASLDEFLDCLDFAPNGVIDMIKTKAVDVRLNDVNKRQAILAKTGFNVTKAIEIKDEAEKEMEEEDAPKRRVAVAAQEQKAENENQGGTRRTTPPAYKRVVTSK